MVIYKKQIACIGSGSSIILYYTVLFTEQIYKHSLVDDGEEGDIYNIEVMDTAGSLGPVSHIHVHPKA